MVLRRVAAVACVLLTAGCGVFGAGAKPAGPKLVGKPFSTERYGVGLHKGDARRAGVTEALRAMIADGSWLKFVAASVGRSGYQQVVDSP